ncbi:MAG: hypothetical protein FJZ38_10930 [Candidatus Rokubacteria bacterium]|nr:hypothetical protein [Candidatus Rokubacteria bacterium]
MVRFPVRVTFAVVSLLVLIGAGSAQAFNPQPDPPGFGMFGITEVQRAHPHVALPAVQKMRGGLPPGPCRVEMRFVDEAGMMVATEIHTIMPGQTTTMIFTPDRTPPPLPDGQGTTLALVPAVRHQLRGVVTPLDRALPPGPCKGPVATVQVDNQQGGAPALTMSPRDPASIDGDGRTMVWHLFGPLAIGFGHTARFNAVNVGTGVCQLNWAFVDEAGARTEGTAMIRAGEAVHADFAHTDVGRGVALIRAEATTSGKSCPSNATIGTLEGFDSALGHSHSIVPAQLIVPAVQ